MQLLELFIRDGIKYPAFGTSATTSTSSNNLVDANASFTDTVKVGYIAFNRTDKTSAKITAVTNATTLALSDDIFESGDAYVIKSDFTKLDLFEDESVSITDTIKNIKDISKVFTPFSQQFNVPASSTNSKLFKHYEDSDITNSFDARFRVDALIKLNGTDYKKGRLRLTGVGMKNNKAHSYKLVFFGDTIELKDIVGDDDLSRLNFPSDLNFDYNFTNIKDRFTNIQDVCFPLITHSKNMRFTNANGYKSTAGTFLNHFDIKPAIKVHRIIEAIEATYDLDLSNDFFNTSDFQNLFMWMHREKGFMSNADEGGGLNILEGRFHTDTDTDFTLQSGSEIRPFTVLRASQEFNTSAAPDGLQLKLNIDITLSSASDYNLTILRSSNNDVLFNQDFTDSTSFNLIFSSSSDEDGFLYGEGIVDIKFLLTTTSTLTFSQIEITATPQRHNFLGTFVQDQTAGVYRLQALSTANQVIISRHIPKMKVIDFLTNIFKMFNLVAFKQDEVIQVLPFDEFNLQGVNYDITKYVDTKKSTIEKILQYKNVKFNFKSKKSFLVQEQEELLGNNFAGESYPSSNDNEWDGSDFAVELDFEKMLFERVSNQDTNALTTIGQGAMIDKDFNPTIGKPLLLYIKNESLGSTTFTFRNGTAGDTDTLTKYNRPSQVFVNSSGAVSDTSSSLNFGLEIDEFFLQPKGTNLFSKYYLNYITSIYNRQGRIKKVEAFLPTHILLNFNLNDKFIIGNKSYRINSIKSNLLTKKSNLELYSLSESLTTEKQSSILPRLASITVTATTATTVTLNWTPLGDVVANNITGYDIHKDDVFVETLGNDISGRTLTGLESGVTFKIGIRTRYTIDSVVQFSQDRIVFATTTRDLVLAENGDTIITEKSNIIIQE